MWRLQPSEGWGRQVGRWVGLGWTSWFLQEDEEALGLAQRDELSRTYVEEAQQNQTTRRESSCGTLPSSPDTQQEPHSSQTRSQTPSTRITTWEAGWNVTNAIQVGGEGRGRGGDGRGGGVRRGEKRRGEAQAERRGCERGEKREGVRVQERREKRERVEEKSRS